MESNLYFDRSGQGLLYIGEKMYPRKEIIHGMKTLHNQLLCGNNRLYLVNQEINLPYMNPKKLRVLHVDQVESLYLNQLDTNSNILERKKFILLLIRMLLIVQIVVIIDFKKGFEILEVLKISSSECLHFLDIFGATHDHLLTKECKYVNM